MKAGLTHPLGKGGLVPRARSCEHIKRHWIGHFKRVNFMVCELYLNFLKKQIKLPLIATQPEKNKTNQARSGSLKVECDFVSASRQFIGKLENPQILPSHSPPAKLKPMGQYECDCPFKQPGLQTFRNSLTGSYTYVLKVNFISLLQWVPDRSLLKTHFS